MLKNDKLPLKWGDAVYKTEELYIPKFQNHPPLHEAVINYNKEIINILLDNGANTTIINNNGETFEILLMKSIHKYGLTFFKNNTKYIKRSKSYPQINSKCDIDKHISDKIQNLLFWRDLYKSKRA